MNGDRRMSIEYAVLPHISLGPGTSCHTPATWATPVRLDDPATSVMTDFREVSPVTIEPHSNISTALRKMKVAGVRLLFVPDQVDNIIGLVTATDIQGERPVKLTQETGIAHEQIRVDMIMTPLDQIMAIDMVAVRDARVGHIINTLRELERQHTLVVEVDRTTGRQTIRGMFSTSHISRMIGHDITDPEYAAHSLAEIQQELA
jgi:CBS domain-containing protein